MVIHTTKCNKSSAAVAETGNRLPTIDIGLKRAGALLCPFSGEGGGARPHLTQCRLVEAYLPTKWHLDPSSNLAATDMGRKLAGSAPLEVGGSPSNTIWPGPKKRKLGGYALWGREPWAITDMGRLTQCGQLCTFCSIYLFGHI